MANHKFATNKETKNTGKLLSDVLCGITLGKKVLRQLQGTALQHLGRGRSKQKIVAQEGYRNGVSARWPQKA